MKQNRESKIQYSILKEFSEGNTNIDHKTYEIEFSEFNSILNNIYEDGLARNIGIARKKGIITNSKYHVAEVTPKGLQYLKDNSILAKGYKTIKEIRDWLPL